MSPTKGNGKYIGMIVLQSLFYGLLDPFAKFSYRDLPVYCFLTLRYLLASALMLLVWHSEILSELKSKPIGSYIVPALCMASAFIVSNTALQLTAATNVAFLRSLSVLFAPLLAFVFYKKRIRPREFVLFAAVLIGLYLLCAKGGLSRFGWGEVLALAAAGLVAGSLVFGQKSLDSVSAITLSFVQTAAAVVICGAMGLAAGSWGGGIRFSPLAVGTLAYAAVFCTIGGYLLQNLALKRLSAGTVGVLQCLYPVIAAAAAFLVLRETLSLAGLAGAAIILACTVVKSGMHEP